MRIDVVQDIDTETREIWLFNLFDLTAVFVGWYKESKPKGKRKWVTVEYWDKYGREHHSMVKEPELPELIKHYAAAETMKYVKVKTWAEYKK